MPQIVPVSDFRADVKIVSKYTDRGEVVVLTQNGRPGGRWSITTNGTRRLTSRSA